MKETFLPFTTLSGEAVVEVPNWKMALHWTVLPNVRIITETIWMAGPYWWWWVFLGDYHAFPETTTTERWTSNHAFGWLPILSIRWRPVISWGASLWIAIRTPQLLNSICSPSILSITTVLVWRGDNHWLPHRYQEKTVLRPFSIFPLTRCTERLYHPNAGGVKFPIDSDIINKVMNWRSSVKPISIWYSFTSWIRIGIYTFMITTKSLFSKPTRPKQR